MCVPASGSSDTRWEKALKLCLTSKKSKFTVFPSLSPHFVIICLRVMILVIYQAQQCLALILSFSLLSFCPTALWSLLFCLLRSELRSNNDNDFAPKWPNCLTPVCLCPINSLQPTQKNLLRRRPHISSALCLPVSVGIFFVILFSLTNPHLCYFFLFFLQSENICPPDTDCWLAVRLFISVNPGHHTTCFLASLTLTDSE